MIKLITDLNDARAKLKSIKCDQAVKTEAEMACFGFGVDTDNLQLYAGFNDYNTLEAIFVVYSKRVNCLIQSLYDIDEIMFFLNGYSDYNIFISSELAHIINRQKNHTYLLLQKSANSDEISKDVIVNLDVKSMAETIFNCEDKEIKENFYLFNSRLLRCGNLKNYGYSIYDEILSVASLYKVDDYYYLCNVYTPKRFRYEGYCRKLVSAITTDIKSCYLICDESLESLYNKCGFTTYSKWILF